MNVRPSSSSTRPAADRRGAFSLIELLLAITIMGVIVAALYAVFDQTQKALRANVTQVDVLESGRYTMELLTRELEQMSPTGIPGRENLFISLTGQNQRTLLEGWFDASKEFTPVVQPLMTPGYYRTNFFDGVFFLNREGKKVTGTGLWVVGVTNGIGSLGRYSTGPLPARLMDFTNMMSVVGRLYSTNYARLTDNVIHFRVQPYDHRGFPMIWQFLTPTNHYTPQVQLTNDPQWRAETRAVFYDQALPAYLELELAVLEPQAAEQLRALASNPAITRRFLSNHVGQVHLFRQRVPIRQSVSSQVVAR